MAEKLLFYYFGDDEAYFRALQGEFKLQSKAQIDFKRVYEQTEAKIQAFFLTIFSKKPDCVFLDFSKQTQDYLHLARLISRTPLEKPTLMVGLVDYLSPPEVLKESIATGVNLNFIKSAETFDVAFSVMKLISPENIGEHGFATATLKEDFEIGVLCKIGYINNEGLHIETDHQFSKGDKVILNHHWHEKRIIPSKDVFVKNVSTTNMFYQFKYNVDLDFLFIDDFLPPEGMPEAEVKLKQNEREESILYQKKQLKRWIDENISGSLEKKAKVLVVDYKFHFYQNQARTDKYPYTIRCIPFFTDVSAELNRLQPQVIAYEFDTSENPKNTMDDLRKLVSIISASFKELNPYLIVSNSQMASQDLQAALQYPQTLSTKEELSPTLLIQLADALQKKISNDSKKVENVPVVKKDNFSFDTKKDKLPAEKKENISKVYIKKNQPTSIAEMLKTVTIIKLSETDCILQSEYPFSPGTNLHFTKPVVMFVNIQPAAKPSGKLPEFYGVIHSMGETDKKELRRYVNGVFFREHDAQLTSENDEFKKLNELKLQEKVNEAQISKDLAEAEANASTEVPEKAKEPDAS